MEKWESLITEKDWEELVHFHTTDIESLPSFQDTYIGQHTPNLFSLISTPAHPDPFTLNFKRDGRTGEHLFFEEVIETPETSDKSLKSYTSRPPAPESDGPKGAATGTPFWPGGFADTDSEEEEEEEWKEEDFTNYLLSKAPGMKRGLEFEDDRLPSYIDDENVKDVIKDMMFDINEVIAKLDQAMIENRERKVRKESTKLADDESDDGNDETEVDQNTNNKYQWAIELDAESDVPDLHLQIGNLAYEFPFTLDPFQKQAILKLHTHDNVMVAAHTSAGKTAIAEYAIALSNHHMTKVIYTSPIKALSNQKFRDFKKKFGEVGLLTGDIQINTDASCLIMTTEILRSMLYNGSDITRDLEWVIFDEVHYINNLERGVVWEEVLIMLPEHVSVILLSATVANVNDFAEWVGNTKRKKVYVITTPRRPVPLEHHLYTGNSDKTSKELFKIISADDKNFNTVEYEKAKAALASRKKTKSGPKNGRPNKQADRNTVLSFVRMLEKENKLPVVFFILSKARINDLAEGLHALDLTVQKEKGRIREFIMKCVARLKGSDRLLPQIIFLTDLMSRGIAIHHSGVLPLVKEVTEMLFEKGLIKLLLATETFAMGINMPTKTVVFDSIEKFDGESKRLLETSEYIQMAGRAGRRGLDDTGTVVILCKGRIPDYSDLLKMVQGKATDLSSHFAPNYNMILSVLKGKDLKVEEMLKRSFAEFETQVKSRTHRKDKKELEEKLGRLKPVSCGQCHEIETFYDHGLCLTQLEEEFHSTILNTQRVGKHIHPGRLVIISTKQFVYHLAVIVTMMPSDREPERTMKVLVLHSQGYDSGIGEVVKPWDEIVAVLKMSPGANNRHPKNVLRPSITDEKSYTETQINIFDIACVLNQKLHSNMDSIRKNLMQKKYSSHNWDSTPIDTVIQEMVSASYLSELNYDVKDLVKVELLENIWKQRERLAKLTCLFCQQFDAHLRQTCEILYIRNELDRLSYSLSYKSLQFMPEFEIRSRVLKRLRYLGEENQLKLKGKAACAMSTSELVITELVFDNFFKDLPVEAIVAILSCMVFQQRRCAEPELTAELKKAKSEFLRLARKIVEAEVEEGLRANDADFESQFKFGLVEVVHRWAKGEEFSEIMQYTEVDEGTIVRCITRLDEVLRCIKDVARIVGDIDFEAKMERASQAIKRDIVFAASLYVQI